MLLTFNSRQGMEGVDPIVIVDETQYVQDIVDDIVSEEKQNEGTNSNFIDKRLDDLDENDMKKLIFKTPVEREVFYFTYTKAVEFGVRREASRINRHGIVTSLRFCCDREGVRSEKDKNREENQATNGCIGRDCDCHRRLAYGITHLKVMLVMFAVLTFGSSYLKLIDLCLRNSASGLPNYYSLLSFWIRTLSFIEILKYGNVYYITQFVPLLLQITNYYALCV
ncbi:hypothetical protein Cgig2_033117 [Carnegiea gigantea]|uniref:FAR1 domain-containing protein n=1 Tax=Carnegiea gigantea TaxID=171969 RepID=A0A9Q1K1B9_9CARY|nr:hypothetical protein Cgig2_033117 [Carnegiea gigantea]